MTCNPASLYRRSAVVLLLAMWLSPIRLAVPQTRMQAGASEREVEVTYLLEFPGFVSWQHPLPPDVFNVCVIGRSPVGALLDVVGSGRTVQGRTVLVHKLAAATAPVDCQMIFITGSGAQSIAHVLAAVHGRPVLTVTDGQQSPFSRGIINFVHAQGRLRFEVDLAAASANGLHISSKLLHVALRVRHTGRR